MPRGLKVFDVYGEVHLDKDEVRDALRGMPGELGPDADRAGNVLGKRMSDGLARSVEAGSARLAKARRSEQDATDAVKLAEVRLAEARDKGGQKASTLLALEQRLEQAHRRLTAAQSNTVMSTKKLEDAQHRLASSMGDDLDKKLGPRMQKSGDDAGGKLALGMRMSVIRNSPLIVAAIGAGLAAGGPLVMAGATALFAGIGIIAAAQSDKVQAAWLRTWEHIKTATIADARVIEPVLTQVATNVGRSFDRMRPLIQGAFSSSAPQILVFSRGITDLAENALPGLVRSVQAGMPVTQGLANFLAKVGTGLSDFFDRITAHGPAAGAVWSQLGTTMATLLPTLGELIGQGAELASAVLPLMNSGLGLLLKGVTLLGPALPVVVAGLGGLKIARTVAGGIASLASGLTVTAQNLAFASYNGTAFAGTAGKLSTAASVAGKAVGAFGIALPIVGAAVGVVTAAISNQENRINGWAQALLQGGAAAAAAQKEIESAPSAWDRFSFAITHGGNSIGVVGKQSKEAEQALKDLLASMDPVSRTSALLTQATNDLSAAIDGEGKYAGNIPAAQAAYDAALAASKTANNNLQTAIHGVTDAMIAQADQAMAAIDSGFAYRNSVNQLEDAQKALADAQAHVHDANKATRTSSEDVQRAQLAVEQQTYRTALAYGQQQADLSGLAKDSDEYKRFVQESMLSALMQLRQSAGPGMRAAIDQQIAALRAGGVSIGQNTNLVNTLTRQVSGLTGQIHAVPGQKYVRIDAPTAAQIQQLRNLGYTVTHLPGGAVRVGVTGVAAVEGAINYAARDRFATVHLRQVGAALATGGKVGDAVRGFAGGGAPSRRGDGRISGPGGMFDDMVPAITSSGESIRVGNTEWIINGPISRQQGDDKMAALNAGRADIVVRQPPGRGMVTAFQHSTAGQAAAKTVLVQRLDVHLQGFDIRDRTEVRRFARELRQALLDIDREQS